MKEVPTKQIRINERLPKKEPVKKLHFPTFLEHITQTHPTKKDRLKNIKDGIEEAYRDIGKAIETDFLIYPASGGDAFPILSTNTLVMIDQEPFASPGYEYEKVVGYIKEHPEKTHTVKDLLSDPTMSDITKKAMTYTISSAYTKLHVYESIGFVAHGLPESFDQIFKNLFILGVNLPDTVIQNIGEDNYRISFELQGKEKNIYYLEQALPSTEDELSEIPVTADITKIAQAHKSQKIAVLSKADLYDVAKTVVEQINPDILILDNHETLRDNYDTGNYTFSSFGDNPSHHGSYGIGFGYGESPANILIGKRKQ